MPNVKTGKRRDIMIILEFVLNDNKTKRNSDLLHLKNEKKKSCKGMQEAISKLLEREGLPSL